MFTGKLKVPLCHPECLDRFSFFSKHLSRWIFMDGQKRKHESDLGKKFSDSTTQQADVKKSTQYEWSAPKTKTTKLPKQAHRPTTYISPELMRLMQRNEERSAKNQKRRRPIRPTANASPAKQKWGSTRDKYIDDINPMMARYMRQVMEDSKMQNCLYDINFYGPDKLKKRRESEDPLRAYKNMDYEIVATLLKKIKLFGSLKPREEELLMRAMRALAELSPQQLTAYFAILHAKGVIELNVLHHLQGLLKKMDLEMEQRELLGNAIEILLDAIPEPDTFTHRMPRPTDKEFVSLIRETTLIMHHMKQSEMNDSIISYKKSFIVPRGSERVSAESALEETLFDGRKKDGYMQPWDVPLPWAEFQADFQQLLQFRMNRIKVEKFPYRRGLERYYYDWKRQKAEQKRQIEEAEREAKLMEERLEQQRLLEARKQLNREIMVKTKSKFGRVAAARTSASNSPRGRGS